MDSPTGAAFITIGVYLIGILSIAILIAQIYASLMIFLSSAKIAEKVLWALVVWLLPLIGLIIWYFKGPRKKPFRSLE